VFTSETGSDHLQVIAEEVSRVAELCIGQAAVSFIEMKRAGELTALGMRPVVCPTVNWILDIWTVPNSRTCQTYYLGFRAFV